MADSDKTPENQEALEKIVYRLASKSRQTKLKALRALGPEASGLAFGHVVKMLQDTDKDIRFEAARTLGRLEDKRASEPLAECLVSEKLASVRHAVCMALGSYPGRRTVQVLVEALHDRNENVRYWATKSLGKMGPEAVEALVDALASSSWIVRRHSADAMAAIGQPGGPAVLQALEKGNEDQQFWLLQVLGRSGYREAAGALTSFLKSRNKGLRIQACKALGLLKSRENVVNLILQLKSSYPEIRDAAAEGLVSIGTPCVEPLVKALFSKYWRVRQKASEVLSKVAVNNILPIAKVLAEKNEDARFWAARTLGEIGDIRAVKPLLALLPGTASEVREAFIEALARIGDQRAIPELVKCLGDRDDRICKRAARALGDFGSQAIPHLIEALGSMTYNVRKFASLALEMTGNEAIDSLVELLDDPNPDKGYWAARTLGKMGSRAVDPLREMLNASSSEVRILAINALRDLGSRESVPDIIGCLKDEFWSVRKESALALGMLGDSRALDSLMETLDDEDEVLRARVAEALGRIGDAKAGQALIPLCADVYTGTRRAAVEALGMLGDDMGLEPCLEALQDHDEEVVLAAISSLARMKAVRAVPQLMEMVSASRETEEGRALSAAAIRALGTLGDPRAFRVLGDLVTSSDELFSGLASEALAKIEDYVAEKVFLAGIRSPFWQTRKHCSVGLSRLLRRKQAEGKSVLDQCRGTEKGPEEKAETQFKLGVAFTRKGMLDEAVVSFNKVIAIIPGHVRAHINLGLIYEEKNMLDEAVSCFKRAIKLDPQMPEPQLFLGVAYGLLGMKNQSRGQFRQVMEKFPNSEQARIASDLLRNML